jgi:hypothetical protein
MRLTGVVMLRNEADIVEAFVRHNLSLLDHLTVIEHGSIDGTERILAALAAEGLPLSVEADDGLAFRQGERLADAARRSAEQHRADWVFFLDADEFLLSENRDELEAALRRAGPPLVTLPWVIYVPETRGSDAAHPFERVPLRAELPRPSLSKVAIAHALAVRPDWVLAPGNHHVGVADAGQWRALAANPLQAVALAHLPFRSPPQLIAKVAIGWLSHRLAAGPRAEASPINAHWRNLFHTWLGGRSPDWSELQERALEWYALAPAAEVAPIARDAVRLVHDPLPIRTALRYPQAVQVDPARLLAAWSERLLAMLRVAAP